MPLPSQPKSYLFIEVSPALGAQSVSTVTRYHTTPFQLDYRKPALASISQEEIF